MDKTSKNLQKTTCTRTFSMYIGSKRPQIKLSNENINCRKTNEASITTFTVSKAIFTLFIQIIFNSNNITCPKDRECIYIRQIQGGFNFHESKKNRIYSKELDSYMNYTTVFYVHINMPSDIFTI